MKNEIYAVTLNDGNIVRVKCKSIELLRLLELNRIVDYEIVSAMNVDELHKLTWEIKEKTK